MSIHKMLTTFTPQLRLHETNSEMLDIMYESPLPFDDDDNDKIEEAEMMEEVIEAPDPFHVVVTDVDMGNESIRSLVSM